MTISPRLPALCALLVPGAIGCRSAPPQAAENVERTALVAQPCPALALDAEPLDPANARVFVEIVAVSPRDLPNPIGRWLQDNAVTIRASANLVAFPGVATSSPWAQCVDAVCADAKNTVLVTARLPERTTEPIELVVRIEETQQDTPSAGPLLDTTLRALHQEPVVLPSPAGLGAGSLVVTAYLLRRFDDLHRVLECKERQKERERELQ
jgi:hypothetical protein